MVEHQRSGIRCCTPHMKGGKVAQPAEYLLHVGQFFFMKITEMNREQLRDYMKASREIYRYDADSPAWKHVFKLAKLAGMENMDMHCSGCVKRAKEWLER